MRSAQSCVLPAVAPAGVVVPAVTASSAAGVTPVPWRPLRPVVDGAARAAALVPWGWSPAPPRRWGTLLRRARMPWGGSSQTRLWAEAADLWLLAASSPRLLDRRPLEVYAGRQGDDALIDSMEAVR